MNIDYPEWTFIAHPERFPGVAACAEDYRVPTATTLKFIELMELPARVLDDYVTVQCKRLGRHDGNHLTHHPITGLLLEFSR